MSGESAAEVAELRNALDHLWGVLPIGDVLALEKEAPEVVEVCKRNHEVVGHGDRFR